jgi:hypothetical protein
MSVVIDAPLTMTWYFDDEITPATEAVLNHVSEAGAVVPSLWRLEAANAFRPRFGASVSRQSIATNPSSNSESFRSRSTPMPTPMLGRRHCASPNASV